MHATGMVFLSMLLRVMGERWPWGEGYRASLAPPVYSSST